MQRKEILEQVNQKPFRPLRVHVSDGRSYEIPRRELALVGSDILRIGIPVPNHPLLLCEDIEWVEFGAISNLSP